MWQAGVAGGHFALRLEDRLEAKSNANATELLERAKARLERIATDTNPARATAVQDKKRLLYKRKTAPSGRGRPRGRSATSSACWKSRCSTSRGAWPSGASARSAGSEGPSTA